MNAITRIFSMAGLSMKRWSVFALFGLLATSYVMQGDAQAQSGEARQIPRNIVTRDGLGVLSSDNSDRRIEFGSAGMRFVPKAAQGRFFQFRFEGIGDGTRPSRGKRALADPLSLDNEVYYPGADGIVEMYRASDQGASQLFLIKHPVSADGEDLILAGQVDTNLQTDPAETRSLSALTFYGEGGPAMQYGPVRAIDAEGSEFQVETRFQDGNLQLVVDGARLKDARYPITVESPVKAMAATDVFSYFFPPNFEDGPVWRVQLRLVTADVQDAATSDAIQVQLNPYNNTWMDYGRNDFQRNDAFTYDLMLDGIQTIRDIQMIRFSKSGTNGWCLRNFALYVNGKMIYYQDFGPSGYWLDDGGTGMNNYVVTSLALRSNTYWRHYRSQLPPWGVTRAELESRIESIVGNSIHGTRLYWGYIKNRAVEVSRKDSRTIHVNIDLAYDVPFFFDPAITVDFDIEFSCNGGAFTLATRNATYNVDFAWYAEVLGQGIPTIMQYLIPELVQMPLQTIAYSASLGGSCPVINILSDGSINFY